MSSNVTLTFAVLPGATSIGAGVGGFVEYIPSDVPDGGGESAPQLPVGSKATVT